MLYDAVCKECKAKIEIAKPMAEEFPPCPKCGGYLGRIYTPVPVHYNAPGFFSSDVGRLRGSIGDEAYAKFERKKDDYERRAKAGKLTNKEKYINAHP